MKVLAIWSHFYQFTFWSLKVYFGEDSQELCLPFHQQPLEIAHVRSHLGDGDFLIAQTKWLIPRTWDCITVEEKMANSIVKLLILRFPFSQHSSGRETFGSIYLSGISESTNITVIFVNRKRADSFSSSYRVVQSQGNSHVFPLWFLMTF